MENQENGNQTLNSEFILLGFKSLHDQMALLFLIFFVIYVLTVSWNLLIIFLIVADQCLHTPMYFFLANLSCLESCYSSTIIPPMLSGFLRKGKHLSLKGCIVQAYFFGSLAAAECFLLAAMAYDRYLAICHPLHYGTFMHHGLCMQLSATAWTVSFFTGSTGLFLIMRRHFCSPWEIDHFFCDSSVLLELSCPVTDHTEMFLSIIASTATLIPFLLTIASYIAIVSTILRIPSGTKRQKAFSTCSSHLTVVTLFYGTLIMVYVAPSAEQSVQVKKGLSLLYTVVTPIFNPIIYSLRNSEVKGALRRILNKAIIIK